MVVPCIYAPHSLFSQPETLKSFCLMLTPTNYKGRNSISKVSFEPHTSLNCQTQKIWDTGI